MRLELLTVAGITLLGCATTPATPADPRASALRELQAALSANTAASSPATRERVVTAANTYVYAGSQGMEPALFEQVQPVLEAYADEADCLKRDWPLAVARGAQREDEVIRLIGHERRCVTADTLGQYLQDYSLAKQCPDGIALAQGVWHEAHTVGEKFKVIHACERCSKPEALPFVDSGTLAAYHYALELQQARQDMADAVKQQGESCHQSCLHEYADYGGQCFAACKGDSGCRDLCRQLGQQCFDQCGQ